MYMLSRLVDDERGYGDEREHVPEVELVDRPRLRQRRARRAGEALDTSPPLHHSGPVGDGGRENRGQRSGAPGLLDVVEDDFLRALRHARGIVVCPGEAREAVVAARATRSAPGASLPPSTPSGRRGPGRRRRARWKPAASMTAVTSSTQSSGADAPSGTGSDIPMPRMSNQRTRANRPSDVRKSTISGCSQSDLEVARPVEHEHDVVVAVAEDLVGELDLAAPRVLRARRHRALEVAAQRLLALDRLEQRLEVPLAEAARAVPLDHLEEHRRPVLRRAS